MNSESVIGTAVGGIAFAVGLIGYVFFDWRFSDGTGTPVAFVLALVAVAIAVGLNLRD